MSRDRETYGSIRRRYDEWVEIVANKPVVERAALAPARPYTPQPERNDMSKTVFAAMGIGIGLLLLLLAAWAYAVSAKWAGLDRSGAAVGYLLVGLFLTISGVGGIFATWNHNFRVMARGGGHSH